MQASLKLSIRGFCGFILLCLLLPPALAQTRDAGGGVRPSIVLAPRERNPLVDSAFDHFYNMDYDRSIQEFERVLEQHPDDGFAVNHLLSTILMRELYRMGAMNSGEYANDSFIGQAHRPADPKVKERIQPLVDCRDNLEEVELHE